MKEPEEAPGRWLWICQDPAMTVIYGLTFKYMNKYLKKKSGQNFFKLKHSKTGDEFQKFP